MSFDVGQREQIKSIFVLSTRIWENKTQGDGNISFEQTLWTIQNISFNHEISSPLVKNTKKNYFFCSCPAQKQFADSFALQLTQTVLNAVKNKRTIQSRLRYGRPCYQSDQLNSTGSENVQNFSTELKSLSSPLSVELSWALWSLLM